MNTKHFTFLLALLLSLIGCSKNDEDTTSSNTPETMYFPENNTNSWETTSLTSLEWNENAITSLNQYLIENNTKSFMILVNGRIVMEEYYNDHTAATSWQWNSAGKTLVTATVGIAQQEGFLDIHNKASDYLGVNWTSEPIEKENLITSKHLLSMTSGMDESKNWVKKSNLTYVADAGTRWAYHNVFQKLMDVVTEASNQEFESYFNTKIKNKIGMDGYWNNGVIFKIYHSNTRSMARYGLLSLNKGKWKEEQILNESFFYESINPSQDINPSYGYLWWINGKTSYMLPGSQTVNSGHLVPNAPAEMYAAMGAKDQRIYIIPSKNMVIIRMGDTADSENTDLALSSFDNDLWEKINAVIN